MFTCLCFAVPDAIMNVRYTAGEKIMETLYLPVGQLRTLRRTHC